VEIPEKAGSFKRFCSLLGKRNITEFNYRLNKPDVAHIFVGLQIKSLEDKDAILTKLLEKHYLVDDMTDNEIAKNHVRHMVGGPAAGVSDEVVYSFVFPERPGALMKFLEQLGERWNISMFHYRNHGAAYGRVLVGLQVPPSERKQLKPLLEELNYRFVEQTDNPVYQRFLK
jgi:threonine dehydratase